MFCYQRVNYLSLPTILAMVMVTIFAPTMTNTNSFVVVVSAQQATSVNASVTIVAIDITIDGDVDVNGNGTSLDLDEEAEEGLDGEELEIEVEVDEEEEGVDVNEVNNLDEECFSIVDLVCGSDDFETLCSLVSTYSGLVAELVNNESTWTVFAPTDEAFATLTGDADDPAATLSNSLSDSQLKKILMFHMVENQKIYSNDFSCESDAPTNLIGMYNGKNARIKCTRKDGTRIPYGIKGGGNDSPSEFGEVDIDAACNGVIHVINDVLLY